MNNPISLNARQHWRGDTAALVLIVIIGAGLRAAFLDRIVRFDEAMTYHRFVSKSLLEAISNYETTNNHPLHSFLANIAVSMAGDQPWILRLPAFMAGILIIPAAYLWAKEEYGERVGLLAAGLTASASFLVDYSTRARGYSLTTLMFVLSLVVARRLMTRWDNRKALALAVLSALALYTIPVAVYSVGMVWVWLTICLVIKRRGKDWMQLMRGGVVIGVVTAMLTTTLYMPIILHEGLSALVANREIRPVPWSEFTQIVPALSAWILKAWFSDLPPLIIGIMVACFAASILAHRKLATTAYPVALTAALLPVVVALQRVPPLPRLFLFFMPVYLSGVASVIVTAVRWLAGRIKLLYQPTFIRLGAVITVLGLGGIIYLNEPDAQWDIQPEEKPSLAVVDYLSSLVSPNDGVTGEQQAAEVVSYYLISNGRPVVLIMGGFFSYPRSYVPDRMYVVAPAHWRDPVRSSRFILGQIRGFDPTAYTAPELIAVVDGMNIYVVTAK